MRNLGLSVSSVTSTASKFRNFFSTNGTALSKFRRRGHTIFKLHEKAKSRMFGAFLSRSFLFDLKEKSSESRESFRIVSVKFDTPHSVRSRDFANINRLWRLRKEWDSGDKLVISKDTAVIMIAITSLIEYYFSTVSSSSSSSSSCSFIVTDIGNLSTLQPVN